jgi:hypothetical protein
MLIIESTIRMPSSDNMDFYKDIVAVVMILSNLFYKGISTSLFERLKSRRLANWRKIKSTTKGVKLPMT